MKILQTITALFIVVGMVSCDDNTPDIKDQDPSYYIRGVINQYDSLNLEYYETEDALKFISPSHTPSFTYSDYKIESLEIGFSFNRNWTERIELQFTFKFPKSEYPLGNLSHIEDIDHLEKLMSEDGWSYGDNYSEGSKIVDVSYSSLLHLGNNQLFFSKYPSDSITNSITNFKINLVEKHEDFLNGEGLLINGFFDCVLYNKEDPTDSIVMNNMKFQGFIQQQYCGRHLCE